MHSYQYQPGDKPLEGYTIKSAAGYGGFGEVYYAISDAGREVALKAVQGYEQIELRGIRQCMNLKNPHLVTIFDVKHNDKNQPFVLMEYVAGPSLRDLIDESPGGLGPEKTAFFLREIAKGLSYLHDSGIVHRDLKPANIFYENGYVKIGDYGLSKAMNANHHQSQTVTVGTVHYMAPEIGAGKYDRSIDIYAMGVVVYEMLTGKVPFKGDTPSEILMKHLSTKPDLDEIDEPFREVIKKAMAKDPSDRYQSINEMVQTVFGQERMKQSMASFSAADLSMAAAHVGKKVQVEGGGESSRDVGLVDRVTKKMDKVGRKIDLKLSGKHVGPKPSLGRVADPLRDSMQPGQRWTLAGIGLLAVSLGTGLIAGGNEQQARMFMLFAFTATAGAVLGLSLARQFLLPTLVDEPAIIRRVTMGGMAISLAGVVTFPVLLLFGGGWDAPQTMSLMVLMAPLFLVDWPRKMACGRAQRLSFGSAISAGVLAWIASWFVDDMSSLLAIGTSAAIMLSIQALSPFDPTVTEAWTLGDDDADDDARRRDEARSVPAKPVQHHRAAQTTERVNAYSVVVTSHTSPRSRLIALLLAVASFTPFFGICGLQRFYVGKIWTGLLWFMTFGLLGVGQLIDVILIVSGVFKDASGRPLVMWQPGHAQVVGGSRIGHKHDPSDATGPHAAAARTVGFLSAMLSLMASLMILSGLTLSLGLALQIPEALAADVFGSGLGTELDKLFAYDVWPGLMHNVGLPLAIGLLATGGVLLATARRQEGAAHMARSLFGAGGLAIAAAMGAKVLNYSHHVWEVVAPEIQANQIGPAIELFSSSINAVAGVFALTILAVSVLVLAWPPKPQAIAAAPPVEEGV